MDLNWFRHMIFFGIYFLFLGFSEGMLSLGGFWPWKPCKSKCYGNYGCFTVETPYTNSQGILPQKPKKLGVSFRVYSHLRRKHFTVRENLSGLSEVNGNLTTVLIIHGWKDTGRNLWVKVMTRALLRKRQMNVVVVNWKRGADQLNYLQAVANTRLVGKIIARFLRHLQGNNGLHPRDVHLIGHSLGAHIAGYVGQEVRHIGRITGLDPAGPAFENTDPEVRLDPTDAAFVDVIHTDGEQLFNIDMHPGYGTLQKLGSVDYYVNGGLEQPGCPIYMSQQISLVVSGNLDFVENFGCSHLRSIHFFTESINSECRFEAYQCHEGFKVKPGCDSCETTECSRMGFYANENEPRGTFVLNTHPSAPYCIR